MPMKPIASNWTNAIFMGSGRPVVTPFTGGNWTHYVVTWDERDYYHLTEREEDMHHYYSGNAVDQEVAETLARTEHETQVAKKLAMVTAYGDDPHASGTVLAVDRILGEKTYTYVAYKAGQAWYRTGQDVNGHALTWRELVLWLVEGDNPVPVDAVRVIGNTNN